MINGILSHDSSSLPECNKANPSNVMNNNGALCLANPTDSTRTESTLHYNQNNT